MRFLQMRVLPNCPCYAEAQQGPGCSVRLSCRSAAGSFSLEEERGTRPRVLNVG